MAIIDLLIFVFFAALLTRTFLLVRLDIRQRRRNMGAKFLFGAYAILALLPVFTNQGNDPLLSTKRRLNWLLGLIYIAATALFLAIWLKG